jgi:epidermal growth factor receptor substrate 15
MISFVCIGGDVFQTFLASGLPNFVLSHIWNICDIGQTGKLNAEQFALASYFISLKLQGLFSTTVIHHFVEYRLH